MAVKSILVFLTCIVLNLAKEDDVSKLPLCPTNIDYFPQKLPMHCRMPRSTDFIGSPLEIQAGRQSRSPVAPSFYQNLPADKQQLPIPIPISPGGPAPYPFPGNDPPFPMPGGPLPMPGGPFPMPGGPFPMPVPMPGPPSQKLPVIVMPFYSPDPRFKKTDKHEQGEPGHEHKRSKKTHKTRHYAKKHKNKDSESCSDTDSDSSDTSSDTSGELSSERNSWWKKRSGRRSNTHTHTHSLRSHKSKRKSSKTKGELLTPVLQYVTKDGYVIFEKKISKGEAKDWLRMRNEDPDPNKENSIDEAKMKNPINGDDIAEAKQKKNDDGNAEYQDKSEEKAKDATTNKPHMYKKHQKM